MHACKKTGSLLCAIQAGTPAAFARTRLCHTAGPSTGLRGGPHTARRLRRTAAPPHIFKVFAVSFLLARLSGLYLSIAFACFAAIANSLSWYHELFVLVCTTGGLGAEADVSAKQWFRQGHVERGFFFQAWTLPCTLRMPVLHSRAIKPH